jgi:hypothetical protein
MATGGYPPVLAVIGVACVVAAVGIVARATSTRSPMMPSPASKIGNPTRLSRGDQHDVVQVPEAGLCPVEPVLGLR